MLASHHHHHPVSPFRGLQRRGDGDGESKQVSKNNANNNATNTRPTAGRSSLDPNPHL
uniref:HDC13911 n=1 Tax=Drosophila melanogaster TaxID=7227 RepID=Q6IJZ8_DROME|nr:TPA_inf: HDC13911 [Drosophila melanogaster]